VLHPQQVYILGELHQRNCFRSQCRKQTSFSDFVILNMFFEIKCPISPWFWALLVPKCFGIKKSKWKNYIAQTPYPQTKQSQCCSTRFRRFISTSGRTRGADSSRWHVCPFMNVSNYFALSNFWSNNRRYNFLRGGPRNVDGLYKFYRVTGYSLKF
jgi:hypothetical protein